MVTLKPQGGLGGDGRQESKGRWGELHVQRPIVLLILLLPSLLTKQATKIKEQR